MRYTATLAAAGALLSGMAGAQTSVPRDIRSYVVQKLDDFTATVTVVSVNERELQRINPDAVLLYKFRRVQMRFKEPNKARIEGSQEGTKATFVTDGPEQWVQVPKLGIKTYRKYDDAPGKRKTLMDVGLVSEYFLSYADAKFLREGVVDGTPVGVFELTYKPHLKDTSKMVVYIDPKTRVIRKRDAYSQEGKLQAIYHFKEPREVAPGIWFPTRLEAQNLRGVIAGVTAYSDIRVNTGLPDSLFRL